MMKKSFTFSFCEREKNTKTENLLYTQKPSTRKRCWDCALPSPARARKDKSTTSARLDARAVAEGASSFSFSSSSSSSSSFLVCPRFQKCVWVGLEFFYPNNKKD